MILHHASIELLRRKAAPKLGEPSRWTQIDGPSEKKGPAEAATSPSHGSNNPAKGNAVNEQQDTTAPVARAMPDFREAFFGLEELIDVVRRRVNTVEFIVDGIDGRALLSDFRAPVSVHEEERDALHSTARDAAWAVKELSERFDSVTAEVCAVEAEIREAGKGGLSALDDASDRAAPDPLLKMIVELRSLRGREAALVDHPVVVVHAELQPVMDAMMALRRKLVYAAPPARTAAGARAALNEALCEIDIGGGPLAPSLIRSALAYLGSAHVQ